MKSFIDDKTEVENDRTYYRNFENVTKLVDETLAEEFDDSMREIENFGEFSNFCERSKEEGQIDEFKDVEKTIEKFEETLCPIAADDEEKTITSFVYAISFALRFDISERLDVSTENKLQETISSGLFLKLFDNKDRFTLELDNHKFNLQCMEINYILANSSYFLRVHELEKKFIHCCLTII